MRKQKVTQWFPLTVKPARKGPYELGFQQGGPDLIEPMAFPFHWFDGKDWRCGGGACSSEPRTPHGKSTKFDAASFYGINAYWRGLAKEPKHV